MMLATRLLTRVSVRQCIAARTATLKPKVTPFHKQFVNIRALGTIETKSRELNDATNLGSSSETNDLQQSTDDTFGSSTKIDNIPLEKNAKTLMNALDRAFTRFVDVCQNLERVNESNFIRTFDVLTRGIKKLEDADLLNESVKSNLAVMCAILLRCCGELMIDVPEKHRELLAGNLWQFMKEKGILVDISHYNALIRVLNENNTSYDPQKLLDEIESNKCLPDKITYQRLIHQYCMQGDITGATKLLEIMKNKGLELNENTFASLIIGYGKQENPPTITELFDLMKSSNVEPGSKSYTAAIISQIHLLGKNQTADEQLEKIYSSLKEEDIQFNSLDAIKLKTELTVIKGNDTVTKINHYVTENASLGQYNDQNRLISSLLKIGEFEEASKVYWSLKPSSIALKYSNLGRFYIKLLAQHKTAPISFIIDECSKLRDSGYNASAFIHLLHDAASKRYTELVRATLEKLKEEGSPKCQFYWPLLATAENFDDVTRILKEDLSPSMNQDDLLDTFTMWVWPKCSEEIGKLFEINKNELHYDNQLLLASLVQHSAQSDKILDAIKFISEAPIELVSSSNSTEQYINEEEEESSGRSKSNNRRGDIRGKLVGRLLEAVATETKNPELVKKAFSLCNLSIDQVTSASLQAMVQVYILNEDYESAINQFLQISNEYRVTPCKSDLIKYCLEKKDPDNLQKLMNVSNTIHGEANSLFDLATACLECGKYKQAQKIFASPGFRVNPARVYRQARLISNYSVDITVLEKYVHLARNLPDVDPETLYHILITAYERTSNAHKILDLWNRMQEEEFHPGKRSLMMIADALEKNHIDVPFRKPSTNIRLDK